MILILIGLFLIIFASILIAKDIFEEDIILISLWVSVIIGGIILFFVIITIPINQIETSNNIAEFESVQKSLKEARIYGNDYEVAAIQMVIIENNKWLASHKFWNSSIWLGDLWISDKIEKLEPIH